MALLEFGYQVPQLGWLFVGARLGSSVDSPSEYVVQHVGLVPTSAYLFGSAV